MATHSSVLAWRIPRTGEPGRLPCMGSHRVGHDWRDLAAAAHINKRENCHYLHWLQLYFWNLPYCCHDLKSCGFLTSANTPIAKGCIIAALWEVNHLLSKTAIVHSHQIRSVAQSCPTLCDPMNHSTPGLPVHHQLREFTQTHVHRVSDAIQPSHPLSSPSPPAPNSSQHQSLFQWVNTLHEVAKVLEFQL